MRVKIDLKDFTKKTNNLIRYSEGFINEAKESEDILTQIVAELSIDGFYKFLDSMARVHPEMLHHVYEWNRVGSPNGRLYEVRVMPGGTQTIVAANFLPSNSVSPTSNVPFTNKAEVMEMGIPVVIEETNASALFFTIDGQEFFRKGPIVIENPGGEAVRGSFLKYFETFYNVYFSDVYLNSIGFYKEMSNVKEFDNNFRSGVNGGGYNRGRKAAQQWANKGRKLDGDL